MARLFPSTKRKFLRSSGSYSWFLTNIFTLCGWAKPNDVSADGILWGFYEDGTTNNKAFIGHDNSGAPQFQVRGGAGGSGTALGSVSSMSNNRWYHLAGVQRSTTDREVFLDGKSVGTNTTNVGAMLMVPDRIAWGATNDPGADLDLTASYDGASQDVALWSKALRDDEIKQLADGVSPLLVRPENVHRRVYVGMQFESEWDLPDTHKLREVSSDVRWSHHRQAVYS